MTKIVDSFLPNRVIKYWNILSIYVKMSKDINYLKTNLECYKKINNMTDASIFWQVSM